MSKPLSLRLVSNLAKSRWWYELDGTIIALEGCASSSSNGDYKTRELAVEAATAQSWVVDDAGGVHPAAEYEPRDAGELDTRNDFFVGLQGTNVRVMRGIAPGAVLPKEQALRLAAWLVVVCDPNGEEFKATLAAVENT